MRDYYGNIEKYYCQLLLLRSKVTVIKISVCNVMGIIPGPDTNFQIQTNKDLEYIIYALKYLLSK